MRRSKDVRFSFAGGQVDPEMADRGDVEAYYSAALELTNFQVDPRGPAVVRAGTAIIAELPDADRGARLVPFEFERVIQAYLLAFTDNRLRVFDDDLVATDIGTPFAGAILPTMDYTQQADSLVVTTGQADPQIVQRRGAADAWFIEALAYDSIHQFAFGVSYPPISITPSGLSGSITITASADWFTADDIGVWIRGNSGVARMTGYVDATTITADVITNFTSTLAMQPGEWSFDGRDIEITPATTFTPSDHKGPVIQVETDADVFEPWHVGAEIVGRDGVAEITQVIGPREADALVKVQFTTPAVRPWPFTLRKFDLHEPVFSKRRGYPVGVEFHQQRLYLVGTQGLPNWAFGSGVNDLFAFRQTLDVLDDEPVQAELSAGTLARAKTAVSADGLHFLTSNGVFSVRDQVITPQNFVPQRKINRPAKNVRPVELENAMVYVHEGGDGTGVTIQEVSYSEAIQAFASSDLTALAASVINDPVQMAVLDGAASNAATYLYAVNSDGTVAVLNSRREQQMTAWTQWRMDGAIKQVAVLSGQVYFLVERTIDGLARYFLEKLHESRQTDCSLVLTSPTPETAWSGIDHLEGKEVRMIGDGFDLGLATVQAGAVTTPRPVSELEIGLPIAWKLKTLPVVQAGRKPLAGSRHRLLDVTLSLRNARGMTVNGLPLSYRQLGSNFLNAPAEPFSGEVKTGTLGFAGGDRGERATVTVESNEPARVEIGSITATVAY